MTEELKKLIEHAEQVANRESCFLYDLEMSGVGNGRTLRIYIDKKGEEGVSIDDCSKVSRGLDLILDVEDLMPGGNYTLEVSSPGLERPLKKVWHYESAIGETINLQLNTSLSDIDEKVLKKDEKRKKLLATLDQADDKGIEVRFENAEKQTQNIRVPYECIHKAKVVFAMESKFNNKKSKTGKG